MTDLISREAVLEAVEDWLVNDLGSNEYGLFTVIRAVPAVTPKVKPLVWEAGERDQRRADSILGEFCVTFFGGRWLYQGDPRKGMLDAQAAAQADYEARILAALDLSPTPVDASQAPDPVVNPAAIREAALREAADLMSRGALHTINDRVDAILALIHKKGGDA